MTDRTAPGAPQGGPPRWAQIGLNCSKGFRQALQ